MSKVLAFALWAAHEVSRGRKRSEYVYVVIFTEMREGQVKESLIALVARLPKASGHAQAAAIHHQIV